MINIIALVKRLGCILTHKMWVITTPNLNHYMSSGDTTDNDIKTKPTNDHPNYQP